MRKGIIAALAGIVLVLVVLFALRSTTGVEIRLDGSVISDTYEETMEYTQGMTYDALEEQLLSRVQFIEDGTDITAEVRVRGSQEGLVSLGTHELEFVRSDDSVLLHLRVVDQRIRRRRPCRAQRRIRQGRAPLSKRRTWICRCTTIMTSTCWTVYSSAKWTHPDRARSRRR